MSRTPPSLSARSPLTLAIRSDQIALQAKVFNVFERSGSPLLRIWLPLLMYGFIVRYTFVVINSDYAEDLLLVFLMDKKLH